MTKTPSAWQQELSDLITDTNELFDLLQLDKSQLAPALQASSAFKLKLPRSYLRLLEIGNPQDPLLLQFLPQAAELIATPNYTFDPLNESAVNPLPGLLHKYHGRVLLTLTSACAVHCRYCFRRHFPYMDNNPGKKGWQQIFTYIEQHLEIEEIILSGGDPLTLSDRLLSDFLLQMSQIKHIKRLRIHTRIPLVLPQRITEQFLHIFSSLNLEKILIIHANHPRELDHQAQAALVKLHSAGFHLLNQTVLLKDINDKTEILIELSKKLFAMKVLPYYLHLFDKVQNAAHFDLPNEVVQSLYKKLQNELPGYLVPKLAREEAGAKHKTLIV